MMIPHDMTFERALRGGYLGRMQCRAYMDWIKTQHCTASGCLTYGVDPSHLNGHNFGGIGTKTPDWWCIPLCRKHHTWLEADQREFEDVNGSQVYWALMFLTQAIYEGRLVWQRIP